MKTKAFDNYLQKDITEIRLTSIERYKLKSSINSYKTNNLEINFGHFKNFKIKKDEAQNYYNSNRIIKNNDLTIDPNNLFLFFKEYTLESHPILKNNNLDSKFKTLNKVHNSVKILRESLLLKKLLKGRIVKEIKGGFIVTILGFKAFLPHSQHCSQKENNAKDSKLLFKPILLKVLAIKVIKSTFNSSTSSDYFFNIIVSSKRPMENLRKKTENKNIKLLELSSKLSSVKQFKF